MSLNWKRKKLVSCSEKNALLKLPLCSESLLEFCFKGKMFKSREMRRSAQVWVVCWTPYGNTHTVQVRREVRGGKNFSVKVGSSKKGLVLVFCWTCWTLDDRTHWYPSLKLYRSWILYIFNWDQQGNVDYRSQQNHSQFNNKYVFQSGQIHTHSPVQQLQTDWVRESHSSKRGRLAIIDPSPSEAPNQGNTQYFSTVNIFWIVFFIHSLLLRNSCIYKQSKAFRFLGISTWLQKEMDFFANIFIQQHANNW